MKKQYETKQERNARYARAIIGQKLISRTATGFLIKTPTTNGREGYAYTVESGCCECIEFQEYGSCSHTIACEMFAPEADNGFYERQEIDRHYSAA